MTFTSLTIDIQAYTSTIVFIGFIITTLALIINIIAKKNKKLILAISLLLFVIIIDLSSLIDAINFSRGDREFPLSKLSQSILTIPYQFQIILGICAVIIAIYSIYVVYKADKDNINDFSIKEALESLPTGIAFISNNNTIYLSNKIMHYLYKELIGKNLVSGVDILEELKKLENSNSCVTNGDNPVFILKDGTIWQFTKTLREWYTNNYIEIKATDITEFYNLQENTKKVNEVLKLRQERLKELTQKIEKTTEEEIAVNMKVDFHDNFGNLLTLTKEILRETPKSDRIEVITGYFTELSDIITKLASDNKESLSLEKIQIFGENLGCDIIINGDLPSDDEMKTTILLCINESLKNAYCHAGARKLTVDITQTIKTVDVEIHNETKEKLVKITEGGGLKGLRQRIENLGGKFNINAENGVRMKITLDKANIMEEN